MEFWVTQTFNGISYGALLFLLAGGLSLIFGMMRIVNMTHGSYYLLGGYVGLTVIWQTGSFVLAILAGALAIALIGVCEWNAFLKRLSGQELGQVLTTMGFALIFQDLALIIWGFAQYRVTGWIDVWNPPTALKHIAVALMLPAVILVVAAYIRGRIYTTLKHPMLTGIKLWAAAHLLANGDLGSIILFGSFLAWAVYDRISLKSRSDAGAPPIPVGGPGNDLIAIAVGLVAYLALAFAFHPVVIGVPVVGA